MPRPGRIFFDGAVYHVYNRLARGERAFGDEAVARAFVELLREVMSRDEVRVFAWVLMPNHYHLAVQTGGISLDRPMRSLQQRTTRRYNVQQRVFGPLWQGRYRAKLVKDQRYLDQLLVYIHLNPVVCGMVDDPAGYRWSGHRALIGKLKNPVVDVDEVLRLFGKTRRSARSAYARAMRGMREEEWIGERPGALPWWRLGRPPRRELEDPEISGRDQRKEDGDRQDRDRPDLTVEEFLQIGAEILGVEVDELAGRGRSTRVTRARELLAVTGVERYGLRVKDLAEHLKKHPVTATGWVMRGVKRRHEDREASDRIERLDQALISASET